MVFANLAAVVALLLVTLIVWPAIRRRAASVAPPAGSLAVHGAPQTALPTGLPILIEERGGTAWNRFIIWIDNTIYRALVVLCRNIGWAQVGIMAVALLLAVLAVPAAPDATYASEIAKGEHHAFLIASAVAIVATAIIAWNNSRSAENFSITLAQLVGPVAWIIMGDVFMWVDRPHHDEWIDVLGLVLFIGGFMFLELAGIAIIAVATTAADVGEGALSLLARFARTFLAAFGEEIKSFFSPNSDVVTQQAWRQWWNRIWKGLWWTSLPFPLIAFLDQGVLVPWVAFAASIYLGILWKIYDNAGIETAELKKNSTYALGAFAGLLFLLKVLDHAVEDFREKRYVLWNTIKSVVRASVDTGNSWMFKSMSILAAGLFVGAILYGLSKLPDVRKNEWFKRAIGATIAVVFVSLVWTLAAEAAITEGVVPQVTPGYDVTLERTYIQLENLPQHGDGTWIQRREATETEPTSLIWIPSTTTKWRDFEIQAGHEYYYLVSFTTLAPPPGNPKARPPSWAVTSRMAEGYGLARPKPPL